MNAEMADAMMEAMPPVDYEQLATKSDLAEFRAEVSSDISELRSDFVQLSLTLDAKLERGFATQLRWLVTTQFASVALLGAIVAMVAAVS